MAPADRRKKKTSILITLIKLIQMTGIQILGMLAGTITSITFLPQVIKVWKSRSAKDLSLVMLVLLMAGVSLWLVYGLVIMDGAIIYTNSMVLIMTLILLFFKLKYK